MKNQLRAEKKRKFHFREIKVHLKMKDRLLRKGFMVKASTVQCTNQIYFGKINKKESTTKSCLSKFLGIFTSEISHSSEIQRNIHTSKLSTPIWLNSKNKLAVIKSTFKISMFVFKFLSFIIIIIIK